MAKLARLTGLPARVIEDNDLRVDSSTFRKMLLHDQGLILGRYDARITGRDASPAARSPRFDPSYAATYGPFSAAMNAYVREELKFEDDLPYEILAGVSPWNYESRNSYPSVAGPAGVGDEPESVSARAGAGRPARPGLPDGRHPLQPRASPARPGISRRTSPMPNSSPAT